MKNEIIKTEEKRKAGQPTKYKPELQAKLDRAIDDMQGKSEFFNELPIMNNIAYLLDVCETTLYGWCKEHPEFLQSIKRWNRKRNMHFVQLVPTFIDKPTMFIFWAKNILRFKDVYSIEDATGDTKYEFEMEADTFRITVLRELEKAEKCGIDPRKIQRCRQLLDVEAVEVKKERARDNGS